MSGGPAAARVAPAADASAPAALHGTPVSIPAPQFTQVLAQDGTPRDRSALLGKPTALWFYPAAGTPG